MEEKYYLGIDAGTNSVGWCVTDKNYNIVKKQSKHLWGSRLFDEASTAEVRRQNRSNRRRLARRRWRINMLQDIFKDEITKVDPYFFDRLNNSALHKEDVEGPLKNCEIRLFNGNNYTDKQYKNKYKNIYCLRKDLLEHTDEKFDIRLIYLALAHMIKYRGNFLKEGQLNKINNDSNELIKLFTELDNAITKVNEGDEEKQKHSSSYDVDGLKAEKIINIFKKISSISLLKDNEMNVSNAPFANLNKKSLHAIILSVINGGKVDLEKLFDLSIDDLGDTKISVCFSDENFINNILPTLPMLIGNDRAEVINKAYEIYNFRVMKNILKNANGLSEAFVDIYNIHHSQLNVLKYLIKTYARKEYQNFFKTFDGDTYPNYVGSNNSKGVVIRKAHSTKLDNLYKKVKTILNSFDKAKVSDEDKKKIEEINNSIENQTFLLKANSSANGVLPYQLNENEMRIIIESQGKFYPFLLEKDKDFNDSNKQEYKLISILKFKIPYYVGPLTKREKENKSVNRWCVYKDNSFNSGIKPWNFNDIVNKEKTEQEFINSMKKTCTYLLGEPTLPKDSIIYSLFMVLNEMNNWLIDGENIKVEDKEYLFNNLYFKDKNINLKKIKDVLKRKYHREISVCSKGSGSEVEKEDIHSSMSSYVDIKNIFNSDIIKFVDDKLIFANNIEFIEDIILHIVALEDKFTLKEYLSQLNLSEEQISQLSKLKYRDWGKLSKAFLCDIKTDIVENKTAEIYSKSILDLLFETSDNLMQIYSTENKTNVYDFKEQVRKRSEEYTGFSSNSIETFIDEQPTSPAVKRTMRQCVKIICELKHILNIDHFDSYFIECTRHEGEKKRSVSRKKQLQDLYKSAKLSAVELDKFTDTELQSKKLFLYFLQNGKSVYSGESIDLDNLENYDIDHIIPQAKVKDDSINNIVLVEKNLNNKKQDTYPFINAGIMTEEGKNVVEFLYRHKFFSKIKRDRILRLKPLTEQELVGFVNRQLTMTDQSVIGIRNLIDFIEAGKSKIIYSKASNVSDFRKVFGFIKVRDLNNLHHANDAYLNVVVGNVYNKVFSSNFSEKEFRERESTYAQTKIDVEHLFMQDQCIPYTGTKVWFAPHRNPDKSLDEKGSTLEVVRKYMNYNDPMITRMVRTQPGFMSKISLHTAKEGNAMFPIKSKHPYNSKNWKIKYGGYSDLTAPYFILVKSKNEKGKMQFSLENIPTIYAVNMKTSQEKEKFLAQNLGLIEPEIIIPKLLINTKLKLRNEKSYSVCAFTGKSGKTLVIVNLSELHMKLEKQKYFKSITKLLGTNLPTGQKKDLTKYIDNGNDDIDDGKTVISKDKNLEFLNYLLEDVFERPCYKYFPGISSVFDKIRSAKDKFIELSTLKQAQTITEIVKLVGTTRELSNLEQMSLAKNAGSKTINKILNPGTQIIFTSTTGFYQNVIFTIPEE